MGSPKIDPAIREKMKREYIKGDESLEEISLRYGFNHQIALKWSHADGKRSPNSKTWQQHREAWRDKRAKETAIKVKERDELILLDEKMATLHALEFDNQLLEELRRPDVIRKLVERGNIDDVIKLQQTIQKFVRGLGYADKVIVIGAEPKDDPKKIIESEFELLEEE